MVRPRVNTPLPLEVRRIVEQLEVTDPAAADQIEQLKAEALSAHDPNGLNDPLSEEQETEALGFARKRFAIDRGLWRFSSPTSSSPLGFLDQDLLAGIAGALRHRASQLTEGVGGLGERPHLQPVTAAVLEAAFPGRVTREEQVPILGWRPGGTDVAVRASDANGAAAAIELKWSHTGHDILVESMWDLFKSALITLTPDGTEAYVLHGAPLAVWEASPFADLFDDRTHQSLDLLGRRVSARSQRLAWDWLLEGGHDNYPELLPDRIQTRVVGRAVLDAWELRAVQVSVPDCAVIPIDGGWPHGQRPADARRPAVGS